MKLMSSTYSVDYTWATVKIRDGPLAGKLGRVRQVLHFTIYIHFPGYTEVGISQLADIILSLFFDAGLCDLLFRSRLGEYAVLQFSAIVIHVFPIQITIRQGSTDVPSTSFNMSGTGFKSMKKNEPPCHGTWVKIVGYHNLCGYKGMIYETADVDYLLHPRSFLVYVQAKGYVLTIKREFLMLLE
jgi:hypothetical protein